MYIITPSSQVFFTDNLVRIWKNKCTSTGQTGNLYSDKATYYGVFASDGNTPYPLFLTRHEEAADAALDLIIRNLENDETVLDFTKPFDQTKQKIIKSQTKTGVPQISAPPHVIAPQYLISTDVGHLEQITDIICKNHCMTAKVYRNDYHITGHPAVWTIVPDVSGLSNTDTDKLFKDILSASFAKDFYIRIERTVSDGSYRTMFRHNPKKLSNLLHRLLSA